MTLAEPVGMDGFGSSVGADACGCDSGFVTAISMAEAAADRNPAWWNEIRTSADDALDAAYCSSKLLGALIQRPPTGSASRPPTSGATSAAPASCRSRSHRLNTEGQVSAR